MQETLTAKKKVYLGHCVAETLGSAAPLGGFFVAALLQLFKLSDMLITILPDGISGRKGLVPLVPHRFSGGYGCIPLFAEFIASGDHGGQVGRVRSLQSNQLG